MNYGNLIYNKIKNGFFECFGFVFKNVGCLIMYFGVVGVFCIINCCLNAFIGFIVFFCV